MKKFEFCNEIDGACVLYVGSAREISRTWNHLRKVGYAPSHCEPPKFNYERAYGLSITEDGTMYVLSASTALEMICDL